MASSVNFVWRKAAKNHLLKSPSGAVGRDLALRGFAVKVAAQAQVGVKTGALKASIQVWHERDPVYGQAVRIGSRLSYARMHHNGTKPHVILPVKAPQLVFVSGSKIIRTKRVEHPGTRPNRYLSDNLRVSGASIINIY